MGHTGSQKQCGLLGEQRIALLLPEIEHGSSAAVGPGRQKIIVEIFCGNYTDRFLRMKWFSLF